MVLELNGLIAHVKAKAGIVNKSKTEILYDNKIKISVTCDYELIKKIDDYNDFKFLGSGTGSGSTHDIFFHYLPV